MSIDPYYRCAVSRSAAILFPGKIVKMVAFQAKDISRLEFRN